ncbi:deoxynucleoside monophosphate kinase [Klebsiella phage CPRSB]|nr:deoxynucleoside monophosphate kinase [Klebsiella phage CPRSB]
MSNEDVLNIFKIGLEILKERGYNIVYSPDDIDNLIMSNDTPGVSDA